MSAGDDLSFFFFLLGLILSPAARPRSKAPPGVESWDPSRGGNLKMRKFAMSLTLAVAALLVFSSALRAQTSQQPGVAKARSAEPTVDLSGVWEANMPNA